MSLEVEIKFRATDLASLRDRIASLAATPVGSARQTDAYWNHPSRDFAQTDEALRIRDDGNSLCITYKGPKLDAFSKTRKEIEIPFGSSVEHRQPMLELLRALGFRPVALVHKTRERFHLRRGELHFEIAIDHVDGLGDFVEIETTADESSLDNARSELVALANALGLQSSERRSYLELLLEAGTQCEPS